jgi:hypothetical protein
VQRQTPAPTPRPTPSVPQHTTPAPAQHQTPVPTPRPAPPAAQHQAPSRPAPTTQKPAQPASNSNISQSRTQSQAPARQVKEQAKQQQQQQKDQARQRKEQAKQQQKQQKEQAKQQQKQQKEQMKQQQKQQKEQAKQQKGMTSGKPKSVAPASSATHSTASRTAETSASKTPRSRAAYSAPENGAVAGKTASGAKVLTKSGSKATLDQVNSARSQMSGVNRKPLPSGDVTVHTNGRLTINAAGGKQFGVRSNGTISSFRDHEKSVTFDKHGKVGSIRSANLSVARGPHGERTIVSRRADNSRIVSTGRRSGYVERNITVGNRTYVQRTTIINERITTNTFVAYNHGGIMLTRFVTPVFYAPAFYGWAYYPWVAPVHFGFGWFGAPWYIGPNPYFAAYPVYPSAAFWLTDYMLGETLAAAYDMHREHMEAQADDMEAIADASSPDTIDDDSDKLQADANSPITPELKEQIAEEVKQQIKYDNVAATSANEDSSFDELPAVLGDAGHLFIVSSNLDVSTDDQQECGLQPGDILRMVSAPANNAPIVELRVASSKRLDCPAGVTVGIALQDLQEMQNAFRSNVESGLQSLAASQGHVGIPVTPPAAVAAPPRPTLAGVTPVPATDLANMLDEQRKEANKAEAQAVEEAF